MANSSLEIYQKLISPSKFLLKILPLFLFFISTAVFAQDKTPIGQAISTIGKVDAISGEKKERAFKRGDSFFVLETIAVEAASKAQLKFTDGGIINLIASTEYRVDSYVFNDPNQKSSSLSTLVKGGFRAISGSIAKENITGTVVRTPVAVMGLRGTVYEALFIGGILYAGCEEGTVSVSNEYGELEIGPSSPTQYAIVEKGKAPSPSKEKPKELSSLSFDVEGGQPFGPQPVTGTPGIQATLTSPTENIFRKMDLFSDLSDEEIKALVSLAACRSYYPGDVLFRQGDRGNSMYVITNGLLQIDMEDPETNQVLTVEKLAPGDYCGEKSLLTNQPRSSTIIPLIDSSCCEISQETMEKLFDQHPAILQKLKNKIAERDLLVQRIKQAMLQKQSDQYFEGALYGGEAEGLAYDQSRSATRLAPYVGVGVVCVAGIIAIVTQCPRHHHHSSSSSSRSHFSHSSSHSVSK